MGMGTKLGRTQDSDGTEEFTWYNLKIPTSVNNHILMKVFKSASPGDGPVYGDFSIPGTYIQDCVLVAFSLLRLKDPTRTTVEEKRFI